MKTICTYGISNVNSLRITLSRQEVKFQRRSNCRIPHKTASFISHHQHVFSFTYTHTHTHTHTHIYIYIYIYMLAPQMAKRELAHTRDRNKISTSYPSVSLTASLRGKKSRGLRRRRRGERPAKEKIVSLFYY